MKLFKLFRNIGLAIMLVSFVYESARIQFQDLRFNWPLFVLGATIYLVFRFLERKQHQ